MTGPDPVPGDKKPIDPFESTSDAEIHVSTDDGSGPFRVTKDFHASEEAGELTSPFGPGVSFIVVRPGTLGDFALAPEEASLLDERAHPRRRASFTLGRAAAARALSILGVERVAIGRGAHGQPLWPSGVVGSIAHTVREGGELPASPTEASAVAVACAARQVVTAGLGVDVEVADRPLRQEIASRVCLADEKAWVDAPPEAEGRRRRLLALFVAKEATFKAFYPLAEVFLGFADARLVWDADARGFHGELRRQASPLHPAGTTFRARVVEADGLLVAAVQLAP